MSRRHVLKSLVKVNFLLPNLVLLPLLEYLVLTTSPEEALNHFPWYSGFWWTHFTFLVQCYLHHQYSLPFFVLCPTYPFGSSSIQGGRSLMHAGSPYIESLLESMLDFSDIFLDSSISFFHIFSQILGLWWYCILVFSGYMALISICGNLECCFESKFVYSILQLLVKVYPIGPGYVIPVIFR